MNIKIVIIEEIIKRLKKGIKDNKNLSNIKNIIVGSSSEARTSDSLPVINVFLRNVKEANSTFKGRSVNELNFLIRLVCNKKKNINNSLYEKNNEKYYGPLVLLDSILDSIDKDENDCLDLSLNNNIIQNNGYTFEIIEDNDIVMFDINFFVISNEFTYGNRKNE